jgi:outer membrane immunogenic protein
MSQRFNAIPRILRSRARDLGAALRSLAILFVAAAFGGSAFAADLPAKAPVFKAPPPAAAYSWTGFYVGANAGYAWGHSDPASNFTCPIPGACPYINPVQLAAFSAAGTGSLSPNGFTGGGQVGYNYQNGQFLYGVELDIESFRLNATLAGGGLVPSGAGQSSAVATSVGTDWLFTARPRVGWLVQPQLLLYATGGLAVTSLKVGNNVSDNCAAVFLCGLPNLAGASSTSGTMAGYAVGGGGEWAFCQHWSVKAEYLYVNFGSVSTTLTTNLAGAAAPNTMTTSAKLNASIARFGLNYKF